MTEPQRHSNRSVSPDRLETLPELELVKNNAQEKRMKVRKADHPTKDSLWNPSTPSGSGDAPSRPRLALSLLKLHMPPHPNPSGRRKDSRITEALRLKRQQEREIREGRRKRLDWISMAKTCVRGFDKIKCDWHRSRALEQLQNAVKQRESRERKQDERDRHGARRPLQ